MLLGRFRSGEEVFQDEFSRIHPDAIPHLQADFDRIDTRNIKRSRKRYYITREFGFDYIVGQTSFVITHADDEIIYAVSAEKGYLTRFVKNQKPIPTHHLYVQVRRRGGRYVLTEARPGFNFLFPAPSQTDLLAEQKISPKRARTYWSNKAFVWGTFDVIPGTEAVTCPW